MALKKSMTPVVSRSQIKELQDRFPVLRRWCLQTGPTFRREIPETDRVPTASTLSFGWFGPSASRKGELPVYWRPKTTCSYPFI